MKHALVKAKLKDTDFTHFSAFPGIIHRHPSFSTKEPPVNNEELPLLARYGYKHVTIQVTVSQVTVFRFPSALIFL